ncbi:cysteine synthase CysM [Robiginitalea sp.]|uniref:cysteine synthase CysM n=1 Tax=Robiginitalea sp. TaxID=1902411 RepID=UPI003C5B4C28
MPYDLIDLVGKTPLVASRSLLVKPGVTLLFKLEGQNPGGSVKDRAALNMIRTALEAGRITKRTRLVEATSGNTGIALAMIARLYGIEIELIMPENATRERVQTMRAYGAKVTLTAAAGGIEGARDMAELRVQQEGFVMLDQFSNPDNWKAHYKSTGPEIWNDTHGKVTHFVSSMGTTGTIVGTSSFLKEKNPEITIVGVQPDGDSSIPGIRKWPKAYLPKIFDASKVDRIIEVSATEARETARDLASKEGIFAGMSSGGATAAALKLAKELKEGIIVSIVCDRGDRYLSSDLFE